MKWNENMELYTLKWKLNYYININIIYINIIYNIKINQHMIVINDNGYSNPYSESNDNKTRIKEWITKIIKVLLQSWK